MITAFDQGPTVAVHKLRFHGHHGVTENERATGTTIEADIHASLFPTPVVNTDDIRDTVDYIALADLLLKTSQAQSYKTLEALAKAFAETALESFPLVARLRVELRKPALQTHLDLESVGVAVTVYHPKIAAQIAKSKAKRDRPSP